MKFNRIAAAACAAAFAASVLNTIPSSAADPKEPQLLDISQFTVRDENLAEVGSEYLVGAAKLFDDQDKVPQSPDSMKVDSEVLAETSRKNWNPTWKSEFGADSFYIDLGANYVITDIAFFDTNGTPEWTVSLGEPFDRHDVLTVTMDYYNSWRRSSIENPEPSRYIFFRTGTGDSGVSEIALYGYKASELTDEQKAKTAAKPSSTATDLTAGQSFGFNAFIDDPMTAIMAGGNVREYHNFSWLIDSDGKVKFTQGTWGDMDSYYTAMHDQGISIIPCFQGGSTAVSGGDKANEIPVPAGADTLDPASYTVHAQAMYQVAARYGSNKDVDLSTINITDAQEVKVGMGLLGALENSNEPNKNWSGKANYFTPYELAAMCSADYDGHEGTIKNAGVKNADPDFKLAMGGLVGYSTMIDYLDEMKLWFDYNRSDGKFAVDIINVHIGPDDYLVEGSGLADKIGELKKWIEENAPGTELWISEFEVPMGDCEEEGVDDHDNELYQLRYAQRVARTYLVSLASGADRITKFQLRDEGEGVYYNSGLVTGKGEWNKKQAWYYLSCMTRVLKNAELTSAETVDGVCVYEFKDRLNGDIIKCVWSPTNEDKTVKGYTIFAENKANAYLTVPSELAEGTTEKLAVKDGSVTVDVSETPVFITLSGNSKNIVNGRNSQLRPSEIALDIDKSGEVCDLTAAPADGTLNQFYRMFDEPETMPDPIYGDTSGLKTPETNANKSGITAYAFFEKECVFNGFAVYDTYGTGGVSVYDAHTDKLLWSSDLGGYMYRAVTLTEDSAPTDCLKIVKEGGDMNELTLYGYEAGMAATWDVDRDGIIDSLDMAQMRRLIVSGDDTYKAADLVGISKFLLKDVSKNPI